MSNVHEMSDFSSSPKEGNKTNFVASGSSSNDEPTYSSITNHQQGRWQDFKDSFKRDPNASALTSKGFDPHAAGFDLEGAAAATANTGLSRRLKGRHLQMIAIGGSIGLYYRTWFDTKAQTNTVCRDWVVRRIGECTFYRWPCITAHRFLDHRTYAILHGSRSG